MLEIAATDAGLRPLAHDPVDMKEMVLDVAELYSSVAQDKEITLTTRVPEAPLIVRGDRSCLQRALANLLDNAIKFTQQGGAVEVLSFVENGSLVVAIADNGPGIPAEDLSRIYDRFFRGRPKPFHTRKRPWSEPGSIDCSRTWRGDFRLQRGQRRDPGEAFASHAWHGNGKQVLNLDLLPNKFPSPASLIYRALLGPRRTRNGAVPAKQPNYEYGRR
jgi:Signal transduction histidine kinase